MGCDRDHSCMTTGDNGLPGQFLPESSCPDEVSSRILDASALDVSGRWLENACAVVGAVRRRF